jgi:hypothetical protein
MSNGLLQFLATLATRPMDRFPYPPETPWGPPVNCCLEVAMGDGVCRDSNVDEVEDDDWQEGEEKVCGELSCVKMS